MVSPAGDGDIMISDFSKLMVKKFHGAYFNSTTFAFFLFLIVDAKRLTAF